MQLLGPNKEEPRDRIGASPARFSDPAMSHEARRAAIWVGIVMLAGVAIYLAQSLLVIFGALVFAALIDGGARLIGRVLKIARGWRIAIVLALMIIFLIWLGSFAGSQIVEQAAQLPALISVQVAHLLRWAEGQGFAIAASDMHAMLGQLSQGVGTIGRVVGGVFGGITSLVLILVIGVYVALEPRLYERGLAWMLPRRERGELVITLDRMAFTMRRLLAGRVIGMVVEGVLAWGLLELYDVPMAALLGLLTGVFAFIPNIGALISGTIMVMVGFSGGTEMGLYTIFVYFAVHIIDGNIIVPLITRKTVDLAPALVLSAQLIFGVLFGILGLILADPILAMIKVALERRSERFDAVRAAG